MINKIKSSFYSYDPNEFLPIYRDGVLDNKKDFHAYKTKLALKAVGKALAPAAQRIDTYFTSH